jgi:hypothetical protein
MSAPIYKVRDGVIPAIVPSAPITDAHRNLVQTIWAGLHSQSMTFTPCARLVADSEARAVAEWQNSAHIKGEAIDSLLAECDRLRAERDECARNAVEQMNARHAADDRAAEFKAERDAARSEAELAAAKLLLNEETDCAEAVEAAIVRQYARAERAEAELKSEQDNSVFAEAELAAERARLDWLMAGGVVLIPNGSGFYSSSLYHPVSRDGIDAAMKEGK